MVWENSGAKLNQARLQLIEDIGGGLTGLDEDQVPPAAVRALLPELADIAALVLNRDDEPELVEVAHVDRASERGAVRDILDAMVSLRRVAADEVRRGRLFRWAPVVNGHTVRLAARGDKQLLELIERLRIRSLIIVAVRTEGRTLGALALAHTGERTYSAADLAMAQVIARRVAVAVESARLSAAMRRAENRESGLEDALRKWTRVFDLACWGVAVVDGTDRRIDAVNPAFARMHGYGRDELTGRLFDDLEPEERVGDSEQWGGDALGPGSTYESLHVRADGSRFPVLVNVTPMAADGPDAYVVTVQELSDLKRAEERLRRAQRMEAVGRLAGGVAHEVNNMMTIILGFSDLLGRAPELPDPLQRDVEEIRKAATRAGKITQQLLAFSRQQVLQPVDLGINTVVEELAPVLALLLPVNIRVKMQLAAVDTVVRADRAQVEQVLINLAFNARDAMPGGGTIRLVTEARFLDEDAGRRLIGIPFPPGRYGLLSVVDTGHGMDQATLAQVFEPFFTTKPLGLGTGLGLSTVYGIVKQSGGYVWVESALGEGTSFTVALPAAGSEATVALVPNQLEPGEPARGGTVLVVEDEDGVRELAGRILQTRGFHVVQARNGAEAIAALNGGGARIDVVLTDVVVPDLGTDELERRLRAVRSDLPILFMSGYPREDMIERRLIRADHPFLQKPFTAEELVNGIGSVLRKRDEVVGR